MIWIEYFKALLTPIVALLGLYIACQQYKINKKKIKLELYNKRYKIFLETKDLILKISKNGEINIQDWNVFMINTKEHKFLFGKEIESFIEEIRAKSQRLKYTNKELENIEKYPSGSEKRNNIISEQRELYAWIDEGFAKNETLFAKYLDFRNQL